MVNSLLFKISMDGDENDMESQKDVDRAIDAMTESMDGKLFPSPDNLNF